MSVIAAFPKRPLQLSPGAAGELSNKSIDSVVAKAPEPAPTPAAAAAAATEAAKRPKRRRGKSSTMNRLTSPMGLRRARALSSLPDWRIQLWRLQFSDLDPDHPDKYLTAVLCFGIYGFTALFMVASVRFAARSMPKDRGRVS